MDKQIYLSSAYAKYKPISYYRKHPWKYREFTENILLGIKLKWYQYLYVLYIPSKEEIRKAKIEKVISKFRVR